MSVAIVFDRLEVRGKPAMFETVGYSGAVKRLLFLQGLRHAPVAPFRRQARIRDAENRHARPWRGDRADISPLGLEETGRVILDPAIPAYETQPGNLGELREHMAGKP